MRALFAGILFLSTSSFSCSSAPSSAHLTDDDQTNIPGQYSKIVPLSDIRSAKTLLTELGQGLPFDRITVPSDRVLVEHYYPLILSDIDVAEQSAAEDPALASAKLKGAYDNLELIRTKLPFNALSPTSLQRVRLVVKFLNGREAVKRAEVALGNPGGYIMRGEFPLVMSHGWAFHYMAQHAKAECTAAGAETTQELYRPTGCSTYSAAQVIICHSVFRCE